MSLIRDLDPFMRTLCRQYDLEMTLYMNAESYTYILSIYRDGVHLKTEILPRVLKTREGRELIVKCVRKFEARTNSKLHKALK